MAVILFTVPPDLGLYVVSGAIGALSGIGQPPGGSE
jgi:hypothetical protein